jgi:hypothetical protein
MGTRKGASSITVVVGGSVIVLPPIDDFICDLKCLKQTRRMRQVIVPSLRRLREKTIIKYDAEMTKLLRRRKEERDREHGVIGYPDLIRASGHIGFANVSKVLQDRGVSRRHRNDKPRSVLINWHRHNENSAIWKRGWIVASATPKTTTA